MPSLASSSRPAPGKGTQAPRTTSGIHVAYPAWRVETVAAWRRSSAGDGCHGCAGERLEVEQASKVATTTVDSAVSHESVSPHVSTAASLLLAMV